MAAVFPLGCYTPEPTATPPPTTAAAGALGCALACGGIATVPPDPS